MRKKLALVLAATLALSVFAVGCGSNDTNKEDSTPKQEQESKDDDKQDDSKKEVVATYEGETLTMAGFWSTFSTDYYKIKDGETLTINVKGTTNADIDNPWSNWVLVLADRQRDAEGYAAACESIVLRADKWGWGTDYVADNFKYTLNGTELAAIDKATDADVYAKWLADGKAGIDSTIVVTRDGANFTYTATSVCGDNTWVATMNWTTTTALADEMVFFLTGEQCTLEIKSAEVTK